MKGAFLAVALLCVIPGASFASAPCSGGGDAKEEPADVIPPFEATGTLVAMHRGHGGALTAGLNNVDSPVTFSCAGETGCLLTALANVNANINGFYICIFVDGHALVPHPENNSHIAIQSGPVSVGSHTIQMKVRSNAGRLHSWSIVYTLYEN